MADMDEKGKRVIQEMESLRQRMRELEHAEEERKRTEEIFLHIFNATEEGVLLMDRQGTILAANRNTAHLYGIPMERLPGTSIYDLIPADRVTSTKEKVKTVVKTRKPVRFEGRLGDRIFENS